MLYLFKVQNHDMQFLLWQIDEQAIKNTLYDILFLLEVRKVYIFIDKNNMYLNGYNHKIRRNQCKILFGFLIW